MHKVPPTEPTGFSGARDESPAQLLRPMASALEPLLGHSFRLLDDGFVRVIDYMGDDAAVVQAARVSYGEGTKQLHEDRGLIRYLMRHRHTTPFEMCEIKLHIRAPMDVWRQWIRHRTANVNEYSTRYSLAIDATQRTCPDEWRMQASTNRQGSGGSLDQSDGERLTEAERDLHRLSRHVYEERIALGVAREQARKDLPLSTYTEAYWKIDLHNLLHFLQLRMHGHAQQEIRAYATTIGYQIVAAWVPMTWEAFLDYRHEGASLSRIEVELIASLIAGDNDKAYSLAKTCGLLEKRPEGGLLPHRERTEIEAKLHRLGLVPPWIEIKPSA